MARESGDQALYRAEELPGWVHPGREWPFYPLVV
jgi:hypothetical protein